MFNFRKFLMLYFMAVSFVVGDEGAGGDFIIDPAPADPAPADPAPADPAPADPAPMTEADEKMVAAALEKMGFKGTMEEMQGFLQEQQNKELVAKETATLQAKYPDFSTDDVTEYLSELKKTDPDRADMLNSPIGWENIHLNLQMERGDGVFLAPRGVSKEPFDVAKVSANAENGDEAAQIALLYGNN